ncbi:Prp31p [Sugiyamaella lignohabitans]|uniref:Prp31p n=1 Tax=Sugiyamaella lignohabitans TaxID=796027 RepID=A0A161HGB2_9ASCO|nr:Prp31p [Sugiyamaella lignohabitans]ANB11781.1 Prp31p [Sugiyamaella lignohabitans]
MSLAEELLADLGSDDDDFESQIEAYNNGEDEDMVDAVETNGSFSQEPTHTNPEEYANAKEVAARMDLKGKDVKQLSNLMTKLEPILARIDASPMPDKESSNSSFSTIEANPIYQLLVEANEYSVEIDNEIAVVHEFIKENYSKRFDELGSLVPNAIDYAKTVKAIGNDLAKLDNELKSKLGEFLTGATLMIITMSAFENHGKPLSEYELDQVNQACDLLLKLDDAKNKITNFVSERLSIFAPNLTQIISSHTAAQLMGFAGGLSGLAKTPSANIPSLGSKRRVAMGFGHIGIRQQGFLYHSDLIQSAPAEIRKQAMRIVSGRLVLAARVDLVHSSIDGSQGKKWREEINERLEKLVEPPENKGTKALRLPEDKPSKKRGGRRIRKYKEQFKQTELQKAQNRMAFGKEEEEVGAYDESIGLGMAGTSGSSGQVRSLAVDSKTRAKISKGMQSRLNNVTQGKPQGGMSSSLHRLKSVSQQSGLASSLSFTPVQGIELVDPGKLVKPNSVGGDSDRWFKSGTFTQIKPSSGLHLGPGTNPSDSTLPMAPPSKRKRTNDLPSVETKKPKPN